jgi:hypothetical protein
VKWPRLSIAGLMVVVIVVAINLAAGLVVFDYHAYLLSAIGLSGLALQVATIQMCRGQRLSRAFWAGFSAGLFLAATLCFWGMARGLKPRPEYDPRIGRTVVVPIPGEPMWPGWPSYRDYAHHFILRHNPDILNRSDWGAICVMGLVFFTPQLLVALASGLLTLFVACAFLICARIKPSRAISGRRMPGRR